MEDLAASTAALDDFYLMTNQDAGFVPLVVARGDDQASAAQHNAAVPIDLLDGGNHFDDVPSNLSRRQRSADIDGSSSNSGVLLPTALLHERVVQSHLVRPSTNLS
jgi:hypothetical protein